MCPPRTPADACPRVRLHNHVPHSAVCPTRAFPSVVMGHRGCAQSLGWTLTRGDPKPCQARQPDCLEPGAPETSSCCEAFLCPGLGSTAPSAVGFRNCPSGGLRGAGPQLAFRKDLGQGHDPENKLGLRGHPDTKV